VASLNKVQLIGNLGGDPELRQTSSGIAVCSFSLATTEKWDGNEKTEWHKIVAWKRLAETCGQYLTKGSTVYVEGKIQTREWEDKDGNKRWTTEVTARDVQFLITKRTGAAAPTADASTANIPF